MLSFTSDLSSDSDAFVVFVVEKQRYKDAKGLIEENTINRINSFLDVLKAKSDEEKLNVFDVSDKKKCFVIKVSKKHDKSYAQELGAEFYSYAKKFNNVKKLDSPDL